MLCLSCSLIPRIVCSIIVPASVRWGTLTWVFGDAAAKIPYLRMCWKGTRSSFVPQERACCLSRLS